MTDPDVVIVMGVSGGGKSTVAIRSWSVMETVISVVGFALVMLLSSLII